MTKPRPSGPSGPTIPEAERSKRGQVQLKVRVMPGYRERLAALAKASDVSMGELVQELVEREELRRAKRRLRG